MISTEMPDRLLTREQVAELLGIELESVRSTLRRAGITEQRGYDRGAVLALLRRRTERR